MKEIELNGCIISYEVVDKSNDSDDFLDITGFDKLIKITSTNNAKPDKLADAMKPFSENFPDCPIIYTIGYITDEEKKKFYNEVFHNIEKYSNFLYGINLQALLVTTAGFVEVLTFSEYYDRLFVYDTKVGDVFRERLNHFYSATDIAGNLSNDSNDDVVKIMLKAFEGIPYQNLIAFIEGLLTILPDDFDSTKVKNELKKYKSKDKIPTLNVF